MSSLFFIKSLIFVLLALAVRSHDSPAPDHTNDVVCQFSCATPCFDAIAETTLDSCYKKITYDLSSCKSGGTISWVACRNANCYAYACNGVLVSGTSTTKCDDVVKATFVFNFCSGDIAANFQMHDGQLAGNFLCPVPHGTVCAGGDGGGCNVDSAGEAVTVNVCDNVLVPFPTGGDFGGGSKCTSDLNCPSLNDCTYGHCESDGSCSQILYTQSDNFVCRAKQGDCDIAEKCDGTHVTCPPNVFSTDICRGSAADVPTCDIPEYCPGDSATCPEKDEIKAEFTICRPAQTDDDGLTTCDKPEKCDGSTKICPDDELLPVGTVCRPAEPYSSSDPSTCDKPETCPASVDGLPRIGTCPPDVKKGSGEVCRAAKSADGGLTTCDQPEICDGSSKTCSDDVLLPVGTVCRPVVYNLNDRTTCDVEETCPDAVDALTPRIATCPKDEFMKNTVVCREAKSADGGLTTCDIEEKCPGDSNACPVDALKDVDAICRPAVTYSDTDPSTCDKAETCPDRVNGQPRVATCPEDRFKNQGDACRGKLDLCDVADTCPDNAGTKCFDQRNDYGYSFKCGQDCFVCAVPNQATLVNSKSDSYMLQGCNVGACISSWFTPLQWPACANQCISSICPNGKALSNYEIYSCNKDTGKFGCDYKVDGSAGTCVPPV